MLVFRASRLHCVRIRRPPYEQFVFPFPTPTFAHNNFRLRQIRTFRTLPDEFVSKNQDEICAKNQRIT
jgi:hypothetical protein